MTPLSLLALPEVENVADPRGASGDELVARILEIAGDLARLQSVDWEDDLARGGGPCLALGAERRSNPRD
jgi:hypothetical protein